jgi:uncharacterized paraquat-inducible protein A
MSTTKETARRGASWEKSGNTSWTQCPSCDDWFHVGPELLDRPEVKLHCPACHTEFTQDKAKRLVTSG